MNNDFEIGDIVKYEDDSIGTVVVLGNYLKGDSKYSLVCPINENQKDDYTVDVSKAIVLNVEKNGETFIEKDYDIINETISHLLPSKDNPF